MRMTVESWEKECRIIGEMCASLFLDKLISTSSISRYLDKLDKHDKLDKLDKHDMPRRTSMHIDKLSARTRHIKLDKLIIQG
jgi:hypothetical protein